MRSIFAIASLLLFATFASAQDKPAPTLRVIANVDKNNGRIAYAYEVVKQVPVQQQVMKIVNGKAILEVVTTYVSVVETRNAVIDMANSRVITPDGKQLPIDEVWKRLKANDVFALAADSNTPAPAYLSALHPQALVIIPPIMRVPMPMPVPQPKQK